MNQKDILDKFGDRYIADENTFKMGIHQGFTSHFAERFRHRNVLETCTGAGFTTMALAKTAKTVVTVEVDRTHMEQAVSNVERAGVSWKVHFIHGSILDPELIQSHPPFDAAFLDPYWAVSGPDHIYRFVNSNTRPPADTLLNEVFKLTRNVALVLPPFLDVSELADLPEHELEKLHLKSSHELYCLYFGDFMIEAGETEFHLKGQ